MRLLYVIDSLAQGGAERSLVELVPPIVARDVELHIVLLADRPGLQEQARDAGASVTIAAGGGGLPGATWRIHRVVRQAGADLVHTTLFRANVSGRLAGRAARVPITSSWVNTPYGPDHLREPDLRAGRVKAAQQLDAATCRLAVRIHANAVHVAETMASRLRVPAAKVDVIPRGRDSTVLGRRTPERASGVRAELGIGPDQRLVVAAARHEHQKGLDVAVAAMGLLHAAGRDAVLLVAGREGHATERLRSDIGRQDLGGVVRLLGERPDVPDLLAAADVVVLPSRREGFPGVALEAMALEAPVVATDLPGSREALGPAGYLVPVSDPGGLAEGISRVLDDRTSTSRRVAAGRRRFLDRFSLDVVADQMVDFWRRAASGVPSV